MLSANTRICGTHKGCGSRKMTISPNGVSKRTHARPAPLTSILIWVCQLIGSNHYPEVSTLYSTSGLMILLIASL